VEEPSTASTTDLTFPTGITANASGTLWGGVVGAGVEFVLSPNWTVGGEFLHTVYQDRDANIVDPTQPTGNGCSRFGAYRPPIA
jgi:opacity protein-like surface antigen